MKNVKRLVSVVLAVVLLLATLPAIYLPATAATTMTESTFQTKLSTFKASYYDHGSTYKNNSSGTLGYECFGYANYIAKYIYGSYPATDMSAVNRRAGWSISYGSSAVDDLHIGDIVRYGYHSIFITKISGSTIYFTDANYDGANTVRWNKTITKSNLKTKVAQNLSSGPSSINGKQYKGWVAHFDGWVDTSTLTMKYHANGGVIPTTQQYKITTDGVGLRLRSSASTSASTLLVIPDATTITVTTTTAANGYTWGKTTYNGKTGWCAISDGFTERTGYYLSSDYVYQYATASALVQKWLCGSGASAGLWNAGSVGLIREGYTFIGWATTADGSGRVFDQDDVSLKAEDICPDVKTSNQEVTLYAVWKQNMLAIQSVAVATMPTKTTYYVGETPDLTGLSLLITYNDGSCETVTDYITSEIDTTSEGIKEVIIGYGDVYTAIEISVLRPSLKSIEIDLYPNKVVYEIGEELDTTGLSILLNYSDGSSKSISTGYTVSGFDSTTAGEKSVVVTYEEFQTAFIICVNELFDETKPQIVIEKVTAVAGEQVAVEVTIKNNPGFIYLELTPQYSDALTFLGAANGEMLSSMTQGKQYVWSSSENATGNDRLMTLTFEIPADTIAGEYVIGFAFRNAYDYDENGVIFTIVAGAVEVKGYTYGDSTGDGKIDGRDVVRLQKYLAEYDYDTGGSSIEIGGGADATGDGKIDGRDVVRLQKYLAEYDYDSGRSPIILGP